MHGPEPDPAPPDRPSAGPPAPEGRVPGRVWSSTAWMALGRAWGSLCTLAILWGSGQLLTGEAFGRLTFYLAAFLVLDSAVDLGSGSLALQRVARDPARLGGVLATARRMRLGTGLLGTALVGGVALALREPGAGWILLASLYPVTHVLELSTLVFKNELDWRRPVLVRAVAATASAACVAVVLAAGSREAAHLLVAVAAGSTLGNLLLHRVGRPFLPPAGARPEPLLPFVRAALPLGVAGLCQQLYFYLDNVFLRAWRGEVELGHYNVAVRFMSYGILLAIYASSAALPWLSRACASGALGPALARLVQPVSVVAALGAGLAWPWTGELLSLFGEEFRDAGPSLHLLILAACCVYPGAGLLTGLVASGRTRAVLAIAAGGLAVNAVANAAWVPELGMLGAARATLCTEAWVALAAAAALGRAGAWPLARRGLGGPLGWAVVPVGFLAAGWASEVLHGALVTGGG